MIGLVYAGDDRAMCFHMWIEVWINGKWFALDPTLGQGRITATHLKISDAHWNDVTGFSPLLPLLRVMGKMQIDVLEVTFLN